MTDPDLLGDEHFRPVGPTAIIHTHTGPAWADAIPKSVNEQAAIHHNQLRYHELTKLRRGEPNLYRETRYR